MLRKGADFGKIDLAPQSPDPAGGLLATEKRIRLYGEILALAGLILLVLGLFVWQASGHQPYDFRNLVHVPDALKPLLHFDKPDISRRNLEPVLLAPAGKVLIAVLLFFVAGSAAVRRRYHKLACLLALLLLPWPLFGLLIPGAEALSYLIIMGAMPFFIRRKQWRYVLFNLAAIYLTFSYFGMMTSIAEKRTESGQAFSINALRGKQDPNKNYMTSFEQVVVETQSDAIAKAYVVAQEAFLLKNSEVLREQLPLAKQYPARPGSIESRRIEVMERYVGEPETGAAAPDSRIMTGIVLLLAACMLVTGLGVEAVGTRILRRSKRIAAVAETIETLKGTSYEADRSTGKVGLRAHSMFQTFWRRGKAAHGNPDILSLPQQLTNRAIRTMLLAVPFLLIALAALSGAWFFHGPPAESNQAFSNIHLLQSTMPFFSDLGTSQVVSTGMPSLSAWFPVKTVLFIAVTACLLFRRVSLAVRLLAILISVIAYDFVQSSKVGMREVALSTLAQGTIEQMQKASAAEQPLSADKTQQEEDAAAKEAANYTLAQIGYLQDEPEQTRTYLNRLTRLDHSKFESVRWRLALMQEWLTANKMPVAQTAYRVEALFSQAVSARISRIVLLTAIPFGTLGLVLIAIGALQLYRKTRVVRVLADFHESLLRRRVIEMNA